jgi:hypothetical protein
VLLDRRIAEQALAVAGFHRPLTIPGVDVATAAAVIGVSVASKALASSSPIWRSIRRFASRARSPPATGTFPSAEIHTPVRYWSRPRGSRSAPQGRCKPSASACAPAAAAQVAAVAVARKMLVLCWHLLTREENYAFQRPSLTRQKTRRLELLAGAPPLPRRHAGERVTPSREQPIAEQALQHQAELA